MERVTGSDLVARLAHREVDERSPVLVRTRRNGKIVEAIFRTVQKDHEGDEMVFFDYGWYRVFDCSDGRFGTEMREIRLDTPVIGGE